MLEGRVADEFQTLISAEVVEEPAAAECCDVEQEEYDDIQKKKENHTETDATASHEISCYQIKNESLASRGVTQ